MKPRFYMMKDGQLGNYPLESHEFNLLYKRAILAACDGYTASVHDRQKPWNEEADMAVAVARGDDPRAPGQTITILTEDDEFEIEQWMTEQFGDSTNMKSPDMLRAEGAAVAVLMFTAAASEDFVREEMDVEGVAKIIFDHMCDTP